MSTYGTRHRSVLGWRWALCLFFAFLGFAELQASDLSVHPTTLVQNDSQSARMARSQGEFAGAYAMPDQYSAQVVEAVFAQGGNAVDAAVAAGFMLAVTYPEAGNLGGGGFMTLALGSGKHKQPLFLDYRETAPKAATRDMYLNPQDEVVAYKSLVGYAASGVPGTVMGLWQAHQKFGTLPWANLLQPAIETAQQGFVVSEALANTRDWYQQWGLDKGGNSLNFAQYFSSLKAGERFVQPELAQTLKLLAQEGASAFYQGKIAQQLVKQYQAKGGLITLEDLATYQAKWREPIQVEWYGRQVISAPPPSSGGIALAQLLSLYQQLEPRFDAALAETELAGGSTEALRAHFYAELSKRVYADRAEYLGDSDFVSVPQTALLESAYLVKRAQAVNFQAISKTDTIRPGPIESPETTHFSILDAQGNAVANTYTLNMPFGNGVVIEGAGFLMNNEMDDFSTKPGVANLFGVLGGRANEIAPQKRMLSSMSPTLVLYDNQVESVLGTPGGSSIITSVFQTLVNLYRRQMTAQEAVDAPRVHHQLFPKDQIAFHPELEAETQQTLEQMGYRLQRHNYLGDLQLIWHGTTGWQAAADWRGRGQAAVLFKPTVAVPTQP